MPEIIKAQLLVLTSVLKDLSVNLILSKEEQLLKHYEIERQVQLSIDLALGISRRVLANIGEIVPNTSREVFRSLAAQKIITEKLLHQMIGATGIRNLLVHDYGRLDQGRFFEGLPEGYSALVEFTKTVTEFIAS